MNKNLSFSFHDERIPAEKPESNRFAQFVRLNFNKESLLRPLDVSVTSGSTALPNGLPGRAVVSITGDENMFHEEMTYLVDVFVRDDLLTQVEASTRLGIGVSTISSAVVRKQIRGFRNAAATNPRRGAMLVSWVEAEAMWGKKAP